MKTRYSLVSNSSATSFCIYGTCFESDPFTVEFIKKFKEKNPEIIESYINKVKDKDYMKSTVEALRNPDIIKDSDEDFEWREVFGSMFPDGISMNHNYDCGCYWFGQSWRTIGDDQTGKQFKEEIEKKIKDVFGDEVKCSTYEEAWSG